VGRVSVFFFTSFWNHYDQPNKRLESHDGRVPWCNTQMLSLSQVAKLLMYRHIVLRFNVHNHDPFTRDDLSLYGHIHRPRFARALPIDPIGEGRNLVTVAPVARSQARARE